MARSQSREGDQWAFFEFISIPLVELGKIERYRGLAYLRSMRWQICRDYSSLPPPDSIEIWEIKFYYEGLIPELIKATEPKPPK